MIVEDAQGFRKRAREKGWGRQEGGGWVGMGERGEWRGFRSGGGRGFFVRGVLE